MKYVLKSDDYKTGSKYAHLVFAKEDKGCSVVLRSRDDKVDVVVSYTN